MSDNINVTQGSGTTMATDLIGEVHHPRVKIQIGEDGSAVDVSSSNPIPVSQDGAATELKQTEAIAKLEAIDEKLPALSGGRIPVDVGGATVNITGPVTVSNEVEIKNDSGNPIPVTESLKSYEVENNGTVLPLGSNATFTGESFEVTEFSVLNVNVFSDVSSAIDGVKVQFSTDGINWDHEHKTSFSGPSGIGFIFNCEFKFARVVYVNGAAAQTVFRLQTIAKKEYTESSLYTLDQSVKGGMFSKLVKAALTAKNPSGDYVSIDCTNGGNLKVSIEEVEGTLPVSTGLTQPLTDTQLRASAVPVTVSGVATSVNQDTNNSRIGALTEAAPANDTASSGLNGRLQRIAQRLSSLLALLPPSIGQKFRNQSLSVTVAEDQVLNIKLASATSGFISGLTSNLGVISVPLTENVILCSALTVQNSTGVTIELRNQTQSEEDEVFYLPTGSFVTIRGINSVGVILVKRLDNSNTQVRVTAYWEN
jgi:hypothetical protein